MIEIKTIEELEAERERQREAWIKGGNNPSNFMLNLTDADLSDANLKGADLTNANLTNANLRGADLEGANLIAADLSYCHFSFANLKKATLCNCDLRLVNRISSAYLMYSIKSGAVITPSQETALRITFGIRGSKFMAGFIVKELEA